uniref:Larval/pupal rigid cuticle protein 66 n=1 Tax=Hyalophora cecropia TaxID=7123 RepID=CU66_HYACE|nr:RecName: Full=Larval/pupal rigid cuticle protein 66; AltName: Full=HCCP66; Flags: Precursor [Hyalophora cecropia]AAC37204.1 cuticle protein 66 [Hyalophora cecropia]
MLVKFVACFVFVAVASASDFSSFSYGVADPSTGDFKSQIESRLGDNVQGQYSLLESDGTQRTVDYAAGSEGFNAVVRKDPALIAAAPYITAPYGYAVPYAYTSPYGISNLANYRALKFASALPYSRVFF